MSRKLSPEVEAAIARDWIRGRTTYELAAAYKVGFNALRRAIDDARRMLQLETNRTADEVLSEVRQIKWEAWQRWELSKKPITERAMKTVTGDKWSKSIAKKIRKRTGEATWLHVIQWCLKFEAKIRGMAAPIKVDLGFRVAGAMPDELDGQMLSRFADAIQERRAIPVEFREIPRVEAADDDDEEAGQAEEENDSNTRKTAKKTGKAARKPRKSGP